MYSLEVEANGFKKYVQTGVKVDAASRVSLNLALEVGAVNESVTVTASTVAIQRETALIGRTIESRQINDLALNGRNPLNLALMKAGVVGGNFNQFNPDNLGSQRLHDQRKRRREQLDHDRRRVFACEPGPARRRSAYSTWTASRKSRC